MVNNEAYVQWLINMGIYNIFCIWFDCDYNYIDMDTQICVGNRDKWCDVLFDDIFCDCFIVVDICYV